MTSNLYGNPHSANTPAERSGHVVDSVRIKALEFFGADPAHFDLVFVANATAGIKLVADSFRDLAEKTKSGTFWYGYHKDCHTSLVGVREFTKGHSYCFESDLDVDEWLREPESLADGPIHGGLRQRRQGLGLFAYPGQSNMSGRRLPLSWPGEVRASPGLQNTYTLLDCAALAMTSPLHEVFHNPDTAPDFTCLSLYKIFGYPDIGALVVRKDSGHILTLRKYFGGGTVTMVSVIGGAWHRVKGRDTGAVVVAPPSSGGIRQQKNSHDSSLSPPGSGEDIHDGLEDGTLPFHDILALGCAIDVHMRLYGSMYNVSRHTTSLSVQLYQGMRFLTHSNSRKLCKIYAEDEGREFGDSKRQGATIAFNLLDARGVYIPYSDVEKICDAEGFYVRSGGMLEHPFFSRILPSLLGRHMAAQIQDVMASVQMLTTKPQQAFVALEASSQLSSMNRGISSGRSQRIMFVVQMVSALSNRCLQGESSSFLIFCAVKSNSIFRYLFYSTSQQQFERSPMLPDRSWPLADILFLVCYQDCQSKLGSHVYTRRSGRVHRFLAPDLHRKGYHTSFVSLKTNYKKCQCRYAEANTSAGTSAFETPSRGKEDLRSYTRDSWARSCVLRPGASFAMLTSFIFFFTLSRCFWRRFSSFHIWRHKSVGKLCEPRMYTGLV